MSTLVRKLVLLLAVIAPCAIGAACQAPAETPFPPRAALALACDEQPLPGAIGTPADDALTRGGQAPRRRDPLLPKLTALHCPDAVGTGPKRAMPALRRPGLRLVALHRPLLTRQRDRNHRPGLRGRRLAPASGPRAPPRHSPG